MLRFRALALRVPQPRRLQPQPRVLLRRQCPPLILHRQPPQPRHRRQRRRQLQIQLLLQRPVRRLRPRPAVCFSRIPTRFPSSLPDKSSRPSMGTRFRPRRLLRDPAAAFPRLMRGLLGAHIMGRIPSCRFRTPFPSAARTDREYRVLPALGTGAGFFFMRHVPAHRIGPAESGALYRNLRAPHAITSPSRGIG